MNWKNKTSDLAVHVLHQSHHYPGLVKEAAWQVAVFVARVRASNPLSYLLRPVFSHKSFRVRLGLAIVALAGTISFWSPSLVSSFAGSNTGGRPEINILPAGDINPDTIQAVRVPIEHFYISQGFWAFHPGIDMASEIGEPVHPVMAGVVKYVEYGRFDYGNHIIVDHGNGFESLYGHLSKIEVAAGQQVSTDTEIGQVGSTGHSTGPHLHLEIHQDGIPTNPATILGIK